MTTPEEARIEIDIDAINTEVANILWARQAAIDSERLREIPTFRDLGLEDRPDIKSLYGTLVVNHAVKAEYPIDQEYERNVFLDGFALAALIFTRQKVSETVAPNQPDQA